jgi:protein-L-isoaspartate(D-aspartate) O-methyltransferase
MNKNNDLWEFFESLDRSVFMDEKYKEYSDCDEAFPIGFGQTISQPTLVFQMTSYLKLDNDVKVLEIGTGSGFQTAFLAEYAREVYTVEKIEELSNKARERLTRLGYKNVNFLVGDGSEGWPEHAPYDRIIVTAAAGEVPAPLLAQLKNDGIMIVPVGKKGWQKLMLITKGEHGEINEKSLDNVTFVELKGNYGWKN